MFGSRNSPLFLLLIALMCLTGGTAGYFVAERLFVAVSTAPGMLVYSTTPTQNAAELKSTADEATKVVGTMQILNDGLLFQDPLVFSADQESNDTDVIKNTDKGLSITAQKPFLKIFTILDQDFPADVDVSVMGQGLLPDQCAKWYYRLDIRQQLNGNQIGDSYDFIVASDNTWILEHYDPTNPSSGIDLANGSIVQTFDIHQPNKLRMVAKGNHFDMYINNQRVGSADEPDTVLHPQNKIGVAVTTCSKPETALFTNMVVKAPK